MNHISVTRVCISFVVALSHLLVWNFSQNTLSEFGTMNYGLQVYGSKAMSHIIEIKSSFQIYTTLSDLFASNAESIVWLTIGDIAVRQ